MHFASHFLMGWVVGAGAGLKRRERAFIAIAGVVPDLDALGGLVEIATKNTSKPLLWFYDYHHFLCHNLFFALACAGIAFFLSEKELRFRTGALTFLTFHLHLLFDLLGGKGPDGFPWPIYYFGPFSESYPLTFQYQWALNAWQNFLITGICLLITFYFACTKGYSPVEIFSPRADKQVVETLRRRFGGGGEGAVVQ